MKINVRQEIAMWILGLAWTAFAFFNVASATNTDIAPLLSALVVSLLPVILVFLIIFSLRDRKKNS